jgi:hypothetical protein
LDSAAALGAQHAVGYATGNSLVEGLKPEQADGAVFNWDDVDRVVKRSGSADHNNPVPSFPHTFDQDVVMRQRANDPLGWRAAARDSESVMQRAQALWGPMPTQPDPGSLKDAATDAEHTMQLMRQAGYEGELVPTGGSVRVTPASGMRPALVNGVSVNARADAAFQAAGDLLGIGEMYRDYKLLGGLISEAQQNATLDRLKGALQGRLGMMRLLPSPEDLGAVRGIAMDSDGVGRMRYNNADLIDRYGDALRKTEMWRQGIIELDTRSMLITSIGNQRMAPAQWVEENTQRYLRAFNAGLEQGKAKYAEGTLPFRADMPRQLQESIWAHRIAEIDVISYNRTMGIPEGAGQLLSMNRWSYDPSGSGITMRNDMLLDLGPNRGNEALRFVVDGKSSMPEAVASRAQLQRAADWHGGGSVKAATPQGLWPLLPRKGR